MNRKWNSGSDTVPLVKETMNEGGTTKVKRRPTAKIETPMKRVELISVERATDHLVTLMQTPQVVLRVTDGAEAMMGNVDRLAVLRAVRLHAPEVAPLCAAGMKAVLQEIGNQGEKLVPEYDVSVAVWQGSTLSVKRQQGLYRTPTTS